ncbi:MAG TPA: 5-deoxy-glucuronate isomerase [Gemmatimonadota bacterium]|nr:5-deoxy-glucuronate isomerase [Gemmatimonadota bacterium]
MMSPASRGPSAAPALDAARLHLPAGAAATDGDPVVVTPERAGWRFTGLRVIELEPGATRTVATGPDEMLALPLQGSCEVDIEGGRFTLAGRRSVFDGVSDFAYLPVGAEARLSSRGGATIALPAARAERRHDPAYVSADRVPIEARGAGDATRQLTNFFAPGVGRAQRLVAVEVLTPAGNVSSWPPHKHDTAAPGGEAELEEIYYFRFDRPEAFGLHRTYAADFDVAVAVGDGDVFLVPRGYHGPCIALPGYPMYYLNVLAGPGVERSLAFSDDPAHAWVRPSWDAETRDPRVPMTTADGRRSRCDR